MENRHESGKIAVSCEKLREIGIRSLQRVGVPEEDACATVEALLCAGKQRSGGEAGTP